MKKAIMFSTAICVLCFVLGVLSGWHGCMSYNRLNKTEIVKAQNAALKAADKVMDNNQLFDTDGSDAMVDYLNKASVVDSLNKLEQQALAYCSCLLPLCLREHKEHLYIISREGREIADVLNNLYAIVFVLLASLDVIFLP